MNLKMTHFSRKQLLALKNKKRHRKQLSLNSFLGYFGTRIVPPIPFLVM